MLFFVLDVSIVQGQEIIISGIVKNKKHKTMSDISVNLMNARDSTIIAYTFTDNNGKYQLRTKSKVPFFLISISAFDVKEEIKKIDNRTQVVNFIATMEMIQLDEVTVKATKIWGAKDTVNYSVAAFKGKKDIVIGDVLKKMPGIEVAESGAITYKGKAINKFYIENMDMLQGRYGIATNNISANDIATVQVLENHQPIKALEKTEYSDKAAINLKIKEGKKGVFSMTALLGLGADEDLLWQEELTGMYFSKKRQHISAYKTNNNGSNIYKELHSFTANNIIRNLKMSDVHQPTPPSIRFERYNFNNTQAATINNLFKLSNEAELTGNLIFYHNKDRRNSFARTSYLLPNRESKIIVEDISSQNTTNSLEGELRYHLNTEYTYLNNYFTVSANWEDNIGEINTSEYVQQQLDNKSFSIKNRTHWIKRGKDVTGIEIISNNGYKTQPHNLAIKPGLYANHFNNGEKFSELTQHIRSNAFASYNNFYLLSAWVLGDLHINPNARINIDYQTLCSDLDITTNSNSVRPITSKDMRNDIVWTGIETGVSFDVTYNREKMKFNLRIPLDYRSALITNHLNTEKKQTFGKVYFQPSLSIKYNFTSQLEGSIGASCYTQTPELPSLYTGYILQSYRNLNHYDTKFFDTNTFYSSAEIAYKNVLDMFFVGLSSTYSHYKSEGTYGQIFDNNLSITQLLMQPNIGETFAIKGRMSKGFYWKGLSFSTDVALGNSNSENLRQNELVNYKNRWIKANAKIDIKPFNWLTTEYKTSLYHNQGKTSTGEQFPVIKSLTQRGSINIALPFDISLDGTFEHYYNSALQGNKNFSLADLGMNYTYKKVKFTLEWTNILNTKKYISAYYGTLNSYYSEYKIRPMAVMLKVRFKLL